MFRNKKQSLQDNAHMQRGMAIDLIQSRLDYEKGNLETYKRLNVKTLQNSVNGLQIILKDLRENGTANTWENLLKKYINNKKVSVLTETRQFLDLLSEGNFTDACAIIDKHAKNKKSTAAIPAVGANGLIPTAFTIGESVDLTTAQMLAHQFYSRNQKVDITANKLETENAFQRHTDLSKIVILGHGGFDNFAGYNAEGFARLFEKRFDEISHQRRPDKNNKIDLYLIGCEVGREDEHNDSMAQQIANRLHGGGFTNVVVHCAANNEKDRVLMVEVITNPGIVTPSTYTEMGFISARSLSLHQSQQLEKATDKAAIKRIKENGQVVFKDVHPEDQLNKEENIFKPNQNRKQRAADIAAHLQAQKEKALRMLRAKLSYVEKKFTNRHLSKKDRTDFLKDVIDLVEGASVDDWHKVIADKIADRQKWMTERSGTYKLMLWLSKQNFKQAEAFVKLDGPKEPDVAAPAASVVFPEAAAPSLAVYLLAINYLIGELQKEINALKEKTYWFSIFKKFEITTKTTKLNALQSMTTSADLAELQGKANTNLGIRRVSWSWKTERTKDLLTAISTGRKLS